MNEREIAHNQFQIDMCVCVFMNVCHVHYYAWNDILLKLNYENTHLTMVFTTLHTEGNLNISQSISVNRFKPFEHRLNIDVDDQLRTNKKHTLIHTTRPKRHDY